MSLTFAILSLAVQNPAEAPLRPVADHHVHLRSPAITDLFGAQIPAVQLPPDLQRLVRTFEEAFRARDARGLAALFAEDGVMQIGRDWQMGPGAIHIALLGRGGTLRLHAQAFEAAPTIGYVAGSYARDNEEPPGDRGRFLLTLTRSAEGPWRIGAAMLSNLEPEIRTPAVTVDELVQQLEAAGLRRAALLSWAYQFGQLGRRVAGEAAKVRAENDWTAAQAAKHPDRLVAVCSFNPLKDYALPELERCMHDSRFSGAKMHFTTAAVDLRDQAHVDRLRAIFRAADTRRFPIVVHMRTLDPDYGRRDAEIFLNQILSQAQHTPVHIAHLGGWGGYGPETDAAFAVFAEAAAARDPRMANVMFDIAGVISPRMGDEAKRSIVSRLRQAGLDRVLFAIDGPVSPEPWELIRSLPLTDAEISTIARNLAPYMTQAR